MPIHPGLTLPLVHAGRREIHVIDTDYEQYAILRVSLQWQNKEFYVFKYFSKLPRGWGWTAAAPGDPLAQAPMPPQLGAWAASVSPGS